MTPDLLVCLTDDLRRLQDDFDEEIDDDDMDEEDDEEDGDEEDEDEEIETWQVSRPATAVGRRVDLKS